jgi:uncharacterized coiled-coil protein SlyX
MTKSEMEVLISQLEAKIAEQEQTIAEFQVTGERAAELEGLLFDQQLMIQGLEERLSKMIQPSAFTMLGEGWINSAVGKRANSEPQIDQNQIQSGLLMHSFSMVRGAYANICVKFAQLGAPVTKAEQAEINRIMKEAGFI